MTTNSSQSTHVGEWNPALDPNRQNRWCHFILPSYSKPTSGKYQNHPNAYYGMFVCEDSSKELYFSAYNVAFALGYDEPRDCIENLVPASDRKTVDFANGVFLNKKGVRDLVGKTHGLLENRFKTWFEDYVNKCENRTTIDVFDNCPT